MKIHCRCAEATVILLKLLPRFSFSSVSYTKTIGLLTRSKGSQIEISQEAADQRSEEEALLIQKQRRRRRTRLIVKILFWFQLTW